MEIGVLHNQLGLSMPVALVMELWIEIGIETVLVVEKFLVTKQWRVRPNRLEKE